ncbi:MAG: hypothetical protein AAF829_09035 [Pseudomonadota bacterium]
MEKVLTVALIDATGEGVFERAGERPPPLVTVLLDVSADTDAELAPPVIACAEADSARARGALLVSGDGDGVILGLDPIGQPTARAALMVAFARRHAPTATPLGIDAKTGAALSFRSPVADVLFEPTDRKGVVVPNRQNWMALMAQMEAS